MSHVRVAHRAAPVVPVRPALSSHRMVVHRPGNRRPPVAPRFLPILQPPSFSKQSQFIFEDEDEQQQEEDKIYDHPAIVDNDHGRKITTQILVRFPTFIPQQNYPKQPLPRLYTRPIRHAVPKYPPHLYSSR